MAGKEKMRSPMPLARRIAILRMGESSTNPESEGRAIKFG